MARVYSASQERYNAVVALVFADGLKESFEHDGIALQHLQERSVVVQQHAGHAQPVVVDPCLREKLGQLSLAKRLHGGTRVHHLVHSAGNGRFRNVLTERAHDSAVAAGSGTVRPLLLPLGARYCRFLWPVCPARPASHVTGPPERRPSERGSRRLDEWTRDLPAAALGWSSRRQRRRG